MKSKARSWPAPGLVESRTISSLNSRVNFRRSTMPSRSIKASNFGVFGAECTPFLAAIAVFLLAIVPGSLAANAQTTIDVEKITCNQFVTFAVADPNQIGLWLSGYFHGKRGDKILRVQELRKNVEALKSACFLSKNAELSAMEVSESLFPSK